MHSTWDERDENYDIEHQTLVKVHAKQWPNLDLYDHFESWSQPYYENQDNKTNNGFELDIPNIDTGASKSCSYVKDQHLRSYKTTTVSKRYEQRDK